MFSTGHGDEGGRCEFLEVFIGSLMAADDSAFCMIFGPFEARRTFVRIYWLR